MTSKTLREAQLIVPSHDREGQSASPHLEKVRNLLVRHFNGYTETMATGAYVMPDESTKTETVHIFSVAVPYDPTLQYGPAGHTLRAIAQAVLSSMGQEAVYLRHASGEIEFVGRPEEAAA